MTIRFGSAPASVRTPSAAACSCTSVVAGVASGVVLVPVEASIVSQGTSRDNRSMGCGYRIWARLMPMPDLDEVPRTRAVSQNQVQAAPAKLVVIEFVVRGLGLLGAGNVL